MAEKTEIAKVREHLADDSLSVNEVSDLQRNLNALGYTNSGVDGGFGPKTITDVVEFLASPSQREFLPNISTSMWNRLAKSKFADEIKTKMIDQIDHIITSDELLNLDNLKTLQRALEFGLNADQGRIDGIIGPLATSLIERRLNQNPDIASDLNGTILIAFQKMDKLANLDRLIRQDNNSRWERALDIAELRDDIMNGKAGELSENVARAQFLLRTLGYDAGKIDGRTGVNTQNAFQRLIEDNPALDIAAPVYELMAKNAASITKPPTATQVSITDTPVNQQIFGANIPQDVIEEAQSRLSGGAPQATEHESLANNYPKGLIVIDLGHADVNASGTIDPGALVNYDINKDGSVTPLSDNQTGDGQLDEITLVNSFGEAFAEQMAERGYLVAFTREPGESFFIEGDKGEALKARGEYASVVADIIGAENYVTISIHGDKSPNSHATGDFAHIQPAHNGIAENSQSLALGKEIARSFHVGDGQITADVRNDQNLGVLRAFERAGAGQDGLQAATLVELGNFNNPNDLRDLIDITNDPSEAAENMANSVDQFMSDRIQTEPAAALASTAAVNFDAPKV